ncbi:MAG: site-2 protease family protein, partial [Erysipelotrichaceae bacterium]|nr:site-2 protease family protein [Erysipelotrichaceae bacterium]
VIRLLSPSIYTDYLMFINKLILFFNLLPIYPLDGGRIISLILQSLLDLKTALFFHLKVSVLSLCLLSICYLHYQTFIIILYLYVQQIIYYHNIPIILRFSYLYMTNNHHQTIIHNQLKYRRDYNNYYFLQGKLYTSKQILYALLENI